MSAAATTPARARHHAAPSASRWTGTAHLVRLALRRDRVRLTVWISVLTAMMLYTPNALELAYPDEAQRRTRVQLLQTPAGIMMGGPMFGGNETDLGAMMANELMLTLIVATSILAILTVIRHTRAEEEGGTAELVLASPVGRYARTTAALLVVGAVNAVIAVTMTAAMAASGFAVADTAAMCIGVTAVATVFGAVAAVTAQLWRVARTASGAAMALLALAALIRGVGDVIDHSGSALSWFSPIAWAQQMRAFVDLRWWPLALLLVVTVLLIALAAVLEARRQYDDGILATSGERPGAKPIRGVIGLHLVLQRGSLIGWTVGLFLAGLAFGSMTKSLRDAAQTNELIARMLAAQGNDGIYTTMSQFLAAVAAAYVTTAVLRGYAGPGGRGVAVVLAGGCGRDRRPRRGGVDVLRGPGQRPRCGPDDGRTPDGGKADAGRAGLRPCPGGDGRRRRAGGGIAPAVDRLAGRDFRDHGALPGCPAAAAAVADRPVPGRADHGAHRRSRRGAGRDGGGGGTDHAAGGVGVPAP